MARKMKLDSLLAANKKNKGIEKMSEYSNKEKTPPATKPTAKDLLKNAPIEKEPYQHVIRTEDTHEESKRLKVLQEEEPVVPTEPGKRGRKRKYDDPRLKALEMQKISARTKIRIQNLINAKFDGYTPDNMIEYLYEYYLEKGLSKDDRIFLDQVEEAAMAEYKEKPKYQKLFLELEND